MKLSQLYQNRHGETMLEVLIALTLLLLGAFFAFNTFINATIVNHITKEHVIATNLAREGLEAVRNIRDTNWLRYAGERRICWNNNDPANCNDTNQDQIPDTPIEHKQAYRVESSASNQRWSLVKDATNNIRLDLTDGDVSTADRYFQLQYDEATGQYSHSTNPDSIYFREIYTEYLNDTGTALAIDESSNVLRVTVRVQWNDRGKIGDVVISTIITDYLGRNNHN